MNDHVKLSFDVLSLAIVAGALIEALPKIAALMSIIWLGMQMYDWIQKKRTTHRSHSEPD